MFNENITMTDKIISALSYITGGFAGVIWLIFCAFTKKSLKKFLLFNVYQAIFLSLFLYFINLLFMMIYHLLIMIPLLNRLVNSLYFVIYTPVYYNWSITGIILFVMYIYLTIFSFFGRLAYIPKISDIIIYQLKKF